MEVRLASPLDVDRCNALHNLYYKAGRTVKQWTWEFVSPNREGPLPFCIAIEHGEVVGTQALIPVPFIDEQGTFMTAKSEETLVSPTMRGRNLLASLYAPLFEMARDRHFASIWGFTPASRAFSKLGFAVPARTRQLFLMLEPTALLGEAERVDRNHIGNSKLFSHAISVALTGWRYVCAAAGCWRKVHLMADEELCSLEDAEPFDTAFTERFVQRWGGATILRSRDYMAWRVFENPYRRPVVLALMYRGQLAAYVAFCVGDDRAGYLVDLIAAHPLGRDHDERALHVLFRACVHRLKRMGAKFIRGWSVNDHKFDVVVRRVAGWHGFVLVNKGHDAVFMTSHAQVQRGSSHDDFSNWYVTRLFTEGVTG